MSSHQYWLKDINLDKSEELSNYLISQGFKASNGSYSFPRASQFKPNVWNRKETHVSIGKKSFPIFIDISSEDEKNLIKKIIEITKAKDIVNGAKRSVIKDFLIND